MTCMNSYPFFRCPSTDACIAGTQVLGLLPSWSIVFIVVVAGYILNGMAFFTWGHWLDTHGSRYHPIIGIPIIAACMISLIYFTLDGILGLPCYVGILGKNLVIHRRRIVPLADLQFDKITLGLGGIFIPRLSRPSTPLFLSSILANCSKSELQSRLARWGAIQR